MEKINNVNVRPVIQKGDGEKKAKGYKLFTEPYGNIFLLARKKSGKSTVAFEILRRCSSRKTRIVIIASTVFKDHIYKDLDINFYDTDQIENEIIIPILRDAKREGMTASADIQVSFTYQTDSNNYDRYLKKKSFQSFRIRNYVDFIKAINEYNINNIEAGIMGYERIITYVNVKVIQENGGGCYDGARDKKTPTENGFIISPRSKNNNCLFFLFKEHLNMERVNRKSCNLIRAEYNLEPDTPIPFSIAREILEKYLKEGASYELTDSTSKETFTNTEPPHGADILCYLDNGHYYRLIKRFKNKCETCLTEYYDKHKCNPNKINYVNRKILKNGKRSLITTFITEKKNNKDEVLHYDLESYRNKLIAMGYDIHDCYIVGYTVGNEGFKFFAGENCLSDFLDEIIERGRRMAEEYKKNHKPEGKIAGKRRSTKEPRKTQVPKLIVNAFNGANFDHYFIHQELIKRGIKPVGKINNGSIISLEFQNIKLWDLCKHTQGSLKDNLEGLGCKVLKGDFDHEKATRWEDMSEELKAECLKYLEKDVMGLKELYDKLNTSIFETHKVNMTSYISTSSLAFNIWKGYINGKFDVRLPTIEQEKAFRKAVIGARTYPSKKRFISKQYERYIKKELTFEQITDFLIDADVVSLYPAAMLLAFMIGDIIKSDGPFNPADLKPGIYNVDYVSPKNILHARIGQRNEKGSLKWNLADMKDQWLTSIDIEDMIKEGYEVRIHKGYYTEKTAQVFEEYIKDMFKAKSNSEKGTPQYLLAKLFMNALYGKQIQRPIPSKSKYISTNVEYWNFWSEHYITDIERFDDKDGNPIYHISGLPRNEVLLEKSITKPTHYGAFVLAYSRRIMYEYIKQANPTGEIRLDIYYTDTDSLQMHVECAKKIPRLGDKSIGGITDDLGDGCKIIRGLWIAPKLYMLEFTTKDAFTEGLTKEDQKHISKGVHIKTNEHGVKQYFHFRGKGLNAQELNVEVYEKMDRGESITNTRDFQMKKINTSRNSKQQDIPHFSIIHNENIKKIVNENKWAGREFINDNDSVPLGFN